MTPDDRSRPGFWTGKIYLWMTGFGLAAVAIAALLWGGRQGLFALAGATVLVVGFRISELLIGILTKVRAANNLAIGLLLLFKLAWWGGIFILSRVITQEDLKGLALGFAAFLLTIAAQALVTMGLPTVSAPKRD